MDLDLFKHGSFAAPFGLAQDDKCKVFNYLKMPVIDKED
jgi:hypothetical protein